MSSGLVYPLTQNITNELLCIEFHADEPGKVAEEDIADEWIAFSQQQVKETVAPFDEVSCVEVDDSKQKTQSTTETFALASKLEITAHLDQELKSGNETDEAPPSPILVPRKRKKLR